MRYSRRSDQALADVIPAFKPLVDGARAQTGGRRGYVLNTRWLSETLRSGDYIVSVPRDGVRLIELSLLPLHTGGGSNASVELELEFGEGRNRAFAAVPMIEVCADSPTKFLLDERVAAGDRCLTIRIRVRGSGWAIGVSELVRHAILGRGYAATPLLIVA